ncbi:EthD family reductase [Erwinia oleae]|uniref:EthD family reductase n=1 Tax=Erwinia oleae TaxID=796334 RepID=UPI000557565A|nr:EthD family reductase [Erwinia oleae]
MNMNAPVTIYVTYQGDSQNRFDREYYVNGHLPLVMKAWRQYGLLSAAAFFPAAEQAATIALCECIFRDEKAAETAFASPESTEVMADVSRFTDISPVRARALQG